MDCKTLYLDKRNGVGSTAYSIIIFLIVV